MGQKTGLAFVLTEASPPPAHRHCNPRAPTSRPRGSCPSPLVTLFLHRSASRCEVRLCWSQADSRLAGTSERNEHDPHFLAHQKLCRSCIAELALFFFFFNLSSGPLHTAAFLQLAQIFFFPRVQTAHSNEPKLLPAALKISSNCQRPPPSPI